ncbi:MAG: nitrate reductase cytochrome c-type subunit [Planctomycetaceae bacterium]|nr:nitrate reductase cytochrome c-type subunit [Planctomycetaceae bacterium]
MHNLHNNRLPLTLLIGLWAVLIAGGCGRSSTNVPTEKITATEVRSARRAFAGAPPVIPHVSQKADCVTCHTTTGRQVPNMGFAAANPHEGSSVAGATQNCRQCHLFRGADAVFVASTFEGI